MGMKNYNSKEEEKYSEIISLLKSLPEEKAPDNFEFNLMTKIKNGTFNPSQYESSSKFPYWVFAPAGAIVMSAVVFFFVADFLQFDNNSPIFPEPKLRSEVLNEKNVPQTKEFLSKSSALTNREGETPVKVIVEPNDVVVTREYKSFNFNSDKSIELDKILAPGQPKPTSNIKGPDVLVGHSENTYFEFDGFYIGMERAKSSSRVKSKADSLKAKGEKKKIEKGN